MSSGLELPEQPRVVLPLQVYFFDTDAAGVVHNVAYLRMIEVARTELAKVCGWEMKDMLGGEGGCPVVARTEIDYFKPARLGDELEIVSELASLQKVRFFVKTDVKRKADGLLLCSAWQTLVPIDLASGRPKKLREDWLQRWPHLQGSNEKG